MAKGLDKQVYIYSVDTSSFYNEREHELNQQLMEIRQFKSNLSEIINPLNQFRLKFNNLLNEIEHEECHSQIDKLEDELIKFVNDFSVFKDLIDEYLTFDEKSNTYKVNYNSILHNLHMFLTNCSKDVENQLDEEALNHKGIRTLRTDALKQSNLISQFESSLTRALKIRENKTSTDIIVVRAYRYAIFENIIKNGFVDEHGEEYQYFTSSAGAIRNRKSLWIKSKVYKKIANKLMCGLSVKSINKQGGMNINKFNAYTALCTTASTPWENFDIDKAIVVPDFITKINDAKVDYINDETYQIKPRDMDIEINHVDGAGMYLPIDGEDNKSFQFRMPMFKGLLIPFKWDKFIEKFNGNPVVKDIYGKKHNVIEDGIKYIFTESQFKMAKFFEAPNKEGWKKYKDAFKKHGCEASICKESADAFEDKTLNYQVLQSLNEMETSQLTSLASRTIKEIESIGKDLNVMKRLLGADEANERKNPFQRAVEIYPNLINDVYSKEVIKENKRSLVRDARAGKLILDGTKRTYIAPDLYAFCEWLFLGIEVPNGLLDDGEVSCQLYEDGQKLDLLRSPHNFREHCVRLNKIEKLTIHNEEVNIKDWFITNDIFTSTQDLISKQLMFDVDGDDSLIVSNPEFVKIAEEHMKGIRPLQYKLATAKKEEITSDNIYKALTAAYSKNIGELANDICKIWNSVEVGQDELDLIKLLCFESNACIDFAKTLWFPTRPQDINEQLKEVSKSKVPYFMKYAKDKKNNQIEEFNKSVVNQLSKIIPNKRIVFEDVAGEFDYKMLMNNKSYELTEEDQKIVDLYIAENRGKTKLIKEQMKKQGNMKKKGVELQVYKEIRKRLLELGTVNRVVDVLVKYLYEEQNDKHKQTLWFCFGWEIVRNLEWNINGVRRCKCCKCKIDSKQAKQYCSDCAKEKERERKRLAKNNKKVAKIK